MILENQHYAAPITAILLIMSLTFYVKSFSYEYKGECVICEKNVEFKTHNSWFRDHYICTRCGSIPRERAIMYIIKKLYPNYKSLSIHESSPSKRGTSLKLSLECPHYSSSQFVESIPSGTYLSNFGCLNEDLANTSFDGNIFDLVVSQDVMEHVFDIEKVFAEIARILKIGGSHIFTTPLVNKISPTTIRAHLEKGKIINNQPAVFHGNPIADGSLVTYDLGYDITKFAPANCYFTIYFIEDKELGLEKTEYNEVCVMTKYK